MWSNWSRKSRGAAGTAHAFVEDAAKKVAAQALVNRVEDRWGGLDVLIHHAAVEPHVALIDMDEWDWHRTLDVNVTAAFLLMQAAARVMRGRGGGVILNVVGAPQAGAQAGAFAACAGALLSLTRAAARELKDDGVRVHALTHGLSGYDDGHGEVPRTLVEAALHLMTAPDLTGTIVNLEAG